jgi:V/A-type H+-transporting ATPase subunit E
MADETTSEENSQTTASGVQTLIDRIRDEGVRSGEEEAARLIREAETEAASILASARADADAMQEKARAEISTEHEAAEEALRLAARDTIQELSAFVLDAFERQVKRFVTTQLEDREFLREVILTLAVRTAKDTIHDEAVEILLSDHLIERDSGDADAEARIRKFILGLSSEALREGIEFKLDPHIESGVSVRVVDSDLRIDINDESITEFLVRHLLPRYRRILAGDDTPPES